VFRAIEHSVHPTTDGRNAIQLRIGARLLVQVVIGVEAEAVKSRLTEWIAQGVGQRDANHLNRFRLVLGATDPAAVGSVAREIMVQRPLPDERVHLHVLSIEALTDLTRR